MWPNGLFRPSVDFRKTLLCQVEEDIKATIPSGHVVVQWAAMHAAWLYNRYNVHATLKTTPFQSLWGSPYKGKITGFGETVFGLDPKATKYKPAWRHGAWLGKDVPSDMDLISTDGQTIIRTKAIRKIASERDPELLLGMTEGPMDFFGHRQTQSKQKVVALPAPIPQEVDEEAEAVRDQVSYQMVTQLLKLWMLVMQRTDKMQWKCKLGKMLVWNTSQTQKAMTELLSQVGQHHLG